MRRAIVLTAAVAATATIGAGIPLAATASAATATVHKAGHYQFASNNGTTWKIRNHRVKFAAAAESLGTNGVDLTTAPTVKAGYADAGVIVKLGDLNSLFNSSGDFVPPAIVASNDTAVN